ncbi:MAG: hypothetical protein ACXVCY_15275 [Pseudobdellovibrionaceae bacterium]
MKAILFIILSLPFFRIWASQSEVYSETTYVPQYGLISDYRARLFLTKADFIASYVGASFQFQNKLNSSQDSLYEKSLITPLLGGRVLIWRNVFSFAELRTEQQSRIGFFTSNFWEYSVIDRDAFSEFYAESIVLPYYHQYPVSTAWFKQGFRYRPLNKVILDPFIEVYLRRSPTPNLGRDTEQGRIGVRSTLAFEKWNISVLLYEAAPFDAAPHEEGLFIIGGAF